MKRTALMGAAFLALSAGAAHAGDIDWTVEGFVASTEADADYINDDKPDNAISGALGGVRLGVEYQFGDPDADRGLVFGANYYQTLTDTLRSVSEPNGNALDSSAELAGFSGWEITGGYDFGSFTLGVGWGKLKRDTTTYQDCANDHEVYTASFCYAGGNDVIGDQREGLRGGSPDEDTADSIRIFGQYEVNEWFYLTAGYQTADFDQSRAPLAVIGTQPADRLAHPDTSYAQEFRVLSLGAGFSF